MKRSALLMSVMALLLVAVSVGAQRGSPGSELRTVRGTVVDRENKPLESAVVYLKNLRNLTVKTHISDAAGAYRFSGLDPNADYELHAEHGDMTSNVRTISSMEGRKEIVVSIKVDREKRKSG